MAPLGAPRSATCLPSLRCGDSCRHFVCCSSCSCRRCCCSCCCCHCGLWWAWSRSTGERGVCLGLSKVFVRYWKIEMLPHVLGNFLYLLIFGLECWPTTKLPSCLLFFNFALFCVPSPSPTLPLLCGAQVSMSFGFPLSLPLRPQSQLTWVYFLF